MSILDRISKLKEIEADLGCVDHLDEIEKERHSLWEYYHDWMPHEIGWSKLKEINKPMYSELKAIAKYLDIA